MKLAITKKFEKSVKSLPQEVRKSLTKSLSLLEQNPFHPSLHSKKHNTWSNRTKKKIYESRINKDHRFLWCYEGDNLIILLLAGNHKLVD